MTDLIEVKTGDLVGEALAWAVAKAEGLDVLLEPPQYGNPWRVFVRRTGEATTRLDRYNPQEDWSVGGPLIDQYRIGFGLYPDAYFACTGLNYDAGDGSGSAHLTAACRAIVCAKLGDAVQVPKELMP